MKRVLMILAQHNFHDQQFKEIRDHFIAEGYEVDIASEKSGDVYGKFGMMTAADYSFHNIIVDNYDCFVVIGGVGATELRHNDTLLFLLKEAALDGKMVAGISLGVTVLAAAGVLKGKRATVDSDNLNFLINGEAIIEEKTVVSDNNIVTANSSEGSDEFAKNIIEGLYYEETV